MRAPVREPSGPFAAFLGLFLLAGCRSALPPPPVVLYPGEPRPPSEICVMEVVRTEGRGGHATIDIQEILRIGADPEISFSVRPRSGWTPPQHFMGPTPTQPSGPGKDPYTIPVRFELEPGSYRVAFLYVPVPDRFGWTHQSSTEKTTTVECSGGSVYYLEGRYLGDQNGWVFSVTEELHVVGPKGTISAPNYTDTFPDG